MLKPFKEYTKFVLQKELTIYRVFNLYSKLKKLLDNIIRNDNKQFDSSLVAIAKKGLKKFNKYYKAVTNASFWAWMKGKGRRVSYSTIQS